MATFSFFVLITLLSVHLALSADPPQISPSPTPKLTADSTPTISPSKPTASLAPAPANAPHSSISSSSSLLPLDAAPASSPSTSPSPPSQSPLVPCYFIFGDSINDNGNNNNRDTKIKATSPPYGINYPDDPTGRFTNGQNIADLIVEFLGFESRLAPYANATDEDIIRGLVNYASGGVGILEETGKESILGGNKALARSHLSKCLHHISLGNNDFSGNYFRPWQFSSSRKYNPELFANRLVETLTERIRTLYEYGARKVILSGVTMIGRMPSALAHHPLRRSQCVEEYHIPVRIYNAKLKSLVDNFNRDYSDAKFIYVDDFSNLREIMDSPLSYGFAVTDQACCGIGKNHASILCLPNFIPCKNRDQYVFWDSWHPTEAASLVAVKRLFGNNARSFTYPITILELAEL
ncbi:GDSL esterase/lipase At5g45670-like [Punica granatum]|uniref:GDSL esterase/lipase At5g45670-like n=1 Tax=Punica granatum TaxID=22663 RepID=A0A6P8D5A0_PUNGR|nr:GDSL esterase/lipase At5g45670-like [Punica granatum]